MKRIIINCLIFCTFVSVAFANDYEGRKLIFAVSGGLYVPTSDFDDVDSMLGGVYSADAQYFFNDYIGTGLYFSRTAYSTDDFGTGNDFTHNLDLSTFGVSLIGRIPLENMDIYGLAGIGATDGIYELIYEDNDIEYVERQSDLTVTCRLEAGARYYIFRNLSIGTNLGYMIGKMDVKHNRNGVLKDASEDVGGFFFGLTAAVAF